MISLSESAIFYEKLNKAYLYNTEVDMFIGLDIEEIFAKLNQLKLYVEDIYKHCKDQCRLRDEVEALSKRIVKLDNLALHLKLITHSRSRRGLIDAIGSISKSLFGTLDNDDLNLINANIDKLFERENELKTMFGKVSIGHVLGSGSAIRPVEGFMSAQHPWAFNRVGVL